MKENNLAMERMNISEDINRKSTATRTIWKFSDLKHDSQSDGEVFIGYNEVMTSGSEDGSGLAEEPVDNNKTLKVSQFCANYPHLTLTSHIRQPMKL